MGTLLKVRIEEPVPRNDSVAVGVGIDASGETVKPVTVARKLGFGDLESRAEAVAEVDPEADAEEDAEVDAEAEGAEEADAEEEAEGEADATLDLEAEADAEDEPDADADAEPDAEADVVLDICADQVAKGDLVYFFVAFEVADGFREKSEVRDTTRETSDVCVEEGDNVTWASFVTIDDSSKSMPSFSIILLTLYIFTYLNLYV